MQGLKRNNFARRMWPTIAARFALRYDPAAGCGGLENLP
jgi:hypothetical protein